MHLTAYYDNIIIATLDKGRDNYCALPINGRIYSRELHAFVFTYANTV